MFVDLGDCVFNDGADEIPGSVVGRVDCTVDCVDCIADSVECMVDRSQRLWPKAQLQTESPLGSA